MLVVLLRVGKETYAIPSAEVVEVVPRLALRPVPLAPAWIAGFARVRGEVVPVIDLVAKIEGRPAAANRGTRVVLVSYESRTAHTGSGPARGKKTLGILAESVTTTSRVSSDDGKARLNLPNAPYLGEVVVGDGQLLQMVRASDLVPPELEEMLFGGEPT